MDPTGKYLLYKGLQLGVGDGATDLLALEEAVGEALRLGERERDAVALARRDREAERDAERDEDVLGASAGQMTRIEFLELTDA